MQDGMNAREEMEVRAMRKDNEEKRVKGKRSKT